MYLQEEEGLSWQEPQLKLWQGSSTFDLLEREELGPAGGGRVLDTAEAGKSAH